MSVFEKISLIVAQGDLGTALEQLVQYISRENKDPNTLRLLRVLEARFNAIKQKERKGILDTREAQKEYNAVSDALLGIVDDLKAGRNPAMNEEAFASPAANTRITWWIGGAILVLLSVIAGVLISRAKKQTTIVLKPSTEVVQEKKCPDFNGTGFRFLLLPFQNLRNDTGSKPELSLQERIRTLTRNNNVSSEVEILPGKRVEDTTPDQVLAKKLGLTCQADMVIWGQYEMVANDEINVDVQYVFTKAPNLPAGEASDTFRSLSELKANKMKFSNLEQAVLSLCSVMALHEGNTALAEKWLNKLSDPSPEFRKIKKMLQERH